MSAATEQRFQQPRHGFIKLTAVIRTSTGWRRIQSGESPTAIVSRIYGIDTFAAVSANEIDGLEGILVGTGYGPDSIGNLISGNSPNYAVGVSSSSVMVILGGGGVAEGEIESEGGTTIVTAPTRYTGSEILNFGSVPVEEATVAITGQTLIKLGSRPFAWFVARATNNNTASDHIQAGTFIRLTCSEPTAGVGFTIHAYSLVGKVTGNFYVDWSWDE